MLHICLFVVPSPYDFVVSRLLSTVCTAVFLISVFTVASLGFVSPSAVTHDVTLFLVVVLKSDDLVSHHHHSHPLPAFQVVVSPVPFVKFSRIFLLSSGCHPRMVSPAAVRPSPSDATNFYLLFAHITNFASSLAHLLPGITLLLQVFEQLSLFDLQD